MKLLILEEFMMSDEQESPVSEYCLLYDYITVDNCAAYVSLLVLMAIFPGGSGLGGMQVSLFWILLELKVVEVVVTTGAIRHAKTRSNRHHQHPF